MYILVAFASFVIYRDRFGARLGADTVEFWFMMEIAMVCGFITSYSMKW